VTNGPRFVLGLALAALVLRGGIASAWTTRLPGVASIADDVPSIALDAVGNLLTVGDADVTKYAASDGAILWRTRLFDVTDPLIPHGDVSVDATGDVLVTGTVFRTSTPSGVAVVKLAGADGHVLWRVEFDGANPESEGPSTVVIDRNGDVILGGMTGVDHDGILAVKLDGRSGAERWRGRYPGAGGVLDLELVVAVDVHGDVALVGGFTDSGVSRTGTVKVSGVDGRLLWRSIMGGPNDFGQATAVATDGLGDVVVIGAFTNGGVDFAATVVKLDGASGAQRWRRSFDGTAHDLDYANGVAVDPEGNVLVVGAIVNEDTYSDVLVVKLAPDGSDVWRREIDGGDGLYDAGNAVAIIGQRIVVAAEINGNNEDDPSFAAFGLDAGSGAETWRFLKRGSFGGRDRATLVAASASGTVVVAGSLQDAGTKQDALLLDVDASSGEQSWQLTLNETIQHPGVAEAVAVDRHGDAIAVGRIGTERSFDDFAVVKLAGSSGQPLWRASIDGTVHENDDGRAVSLDSTGDVLALGITVDADGPPPTDPAFPGQQPIKTNVTVVKLAGSTGAELWRSSPSFGGPGSALASDVAVDQRNDVLVGGWFGTSTESVPAVVKLDGDSGAESWRFTLPDQGFGADFPVPLGLDAVGDVVVAEDVDVCKVSGATGAQLWHHRSTTVSVATLAVDEHGDAVIANATSLAATKLSGRDGTPLWTVDRGEGRILAIAVDRTGDVVLAGTIFGDSGEERAVLLKLEGATGALRWMRVLPGRTSGDGLALVVDEAGNVLVADASSVARRGADFGVAKLRGRDGVLQWRRQIDGSGRRDDRAQAIALDPRQNPVAVGVLSGAASSEDFAVVKLDGRTGRYR
jgi:hypothetical protein